MCAAFLDVDMIRSSFDVLLCSFIELNHHFFSSYVSYVGEKSAKDICMLLACHRVLKNHRPLKYGLLDVT